jgi:hypothetical protein
MKRFLLAAFLAACVSCTSDSSNLPPPASAPLTSAPSIATGAVSTTKSIKIPNVSGQRLSKARTSLRRAGFLLTIKELFSAKPRGTVVAVHPAEGMKAEKGSSVTLVVAKPLPVIPRVIGKKLAAARRTLRSRGFKVSVKKQVSSKTKGTVLSQSPIGGTRARPGRVVALRIAKAPPSTGGGSSNCTPGYSPCIPPGPDVDCAGGSGDGPRYVSGPVRVTGSDPYGLDSDGDGYGCE